MRRHRRGWWRSVNDKLQRVWTVKKRGRSEQMHLSGRGHLFKFIFKSSDSLFHGRQPRLFYFLSFFKLFSFFFFWEALRAPRDELTKTQRRDRKEQKADEKRENSTPGIGTFVPSPSVCTCRHTHRLNTNIHTFPPPAGLKTRQTQSACFHAFWTTRCSKIKQSWKNNSNIFHIRYWFGVCVCVCVCVCV